MEGYVSPIQLESFPLSAFDMQGSFSNIPYTFFYENTDRSEVFMPSEILKASLRASLQKFPILTGHVRMKGTGKLAVDVDADDLNIPEFLESTCDSIHFADIKASGFSWDKWPDNVTTVGPVATAAADGEIKLLHVHIIRLKDHSGLILFLNIPHYVVDGAGFFAFANHWAAIMKRMQNNPKEAELSGTEKVVGESEFSFDRDIIRKYLPKERTPLGEVYYSIYAIRNLFVDWLAWLSPTTLGGLLSKTVGMARGEAHLFHASREALDRLHESVRSYLPKDTRISDNDLLVALISKTYVQSQVQPKPRSWSLFGNTEPETHCTVRLPCDVRPRLGMKEQFTGNMLVGMFVRNRLEELARPTTTETLASAALEVRKTVNSVKPSLIGEYFDILDQNPTSHMRPLAFTAARTTTSLVTTSQVRFKMYDVDFGNGCPKFACLTPLFAGSYTMGAFLPPPPPLKGVNVLLTSNPVTMKSIREKEFWNNVFKVVW